VLISYRRFGGSRASTGKFFPTFWDNLTALFRGQVLVLVIPCRRFGTKYRSHIQRSRASSGNYRRFGTTCQSNIQESRIQIISCRRFMTTYWVPFSGFKNPVFGFRKANNFLPTLQDNIRAPSSRFKIPVFGFLNPEDGTDSLSRNVRCVISQKSANLIYIAVEDRNYPRCNYWLWL